MRRASGIFLGLTCALLFTGAAHAVVPVPNGNDPGPCTLTLYWDDRVTGCDEVQEGSTRDSLLTAAIENARQVMRAWRRHRPDLIVPYRPGVSDSAIRAEMRRTQYVDSMAVSIASDSIADGGAVLHTRYWLARGVRREDGFVHRQVDRVDYLEAWHLTAGVWRLQGFEEDEGVAAPATPQAGTLFPVRPGVSMAPSDILPINRVSTCGSADEAPPVTEPTPVTTVQPNYPEFARQAQIQGKVILHVCVGRDGRVKNIRVAKGITGLNDAAMEAVRRWVFAPALDEDGNAVSSWLEVPVDFHF